MPKHRKWGRLPGCACRPMHLRAAWRPVREPGERLVGWALLLPGGRGVITGSAFALGVAVPLLMPVSALVAAWSHGSGRRLGVLTDRRLLLIDAGRGAPRVDACVDLHAVGLRAGREENDPVRVRVEHAGRSRWYRPVGNGVERRFVQGVRTLAAADAPGAVC